MIKKRLCHFFCLFIFLCGCTKSQPLAPEPQGPFSYSELAQLNDAMLFLPGVSYSVPDNSQEIAFKKAYRCETLYAASKVYFNAVVLEVDSQDMEAVQEAMSERRTAYLVNEMNTPYRIYDGYTLLHDPVDHYVYLVYETGADSFSPNYHYFVLGDFTSHEDGGKNLIFDIGDLLEYADISPISATQELPDQETMDQIQSALEDNTDLSDYPVIVQIDNKKFTVVLGADYPGSKADMATKTRSLYFDAKEICQKFSVKIDSFVVGFWDEKGVNAFSVGNSMIYLDPYAFMLIDMANSDDYEFIEVLEPPAISGPNTSDITLAEYEKIKEGDSYVRVKKIVGGSGQLVLKEDIFDSTYEIYEWHGADKFSVAQIYFENGAMYSKAQYGLS